VYAAKFEGKLAQSGQLNAEMTIVGEYGVEGEPPAVDQLEGDCKGATHVVSALTVGAFSFYSGSSREIGGSATVMGAGAGAESSKKSESLSRDGDTKACASSKRGDATPPEGCGSLMRLELIALLEAGKGTPLECKPGTKLVGKECKPVEKPSELAPDDKNFTDDKAGVGWGTRCFSHYKAGSLHYARAACEKGLQASPSDDTRAAILFNYALVEEKSGDPLAACEKLSQSLALREGRADKAVIKVLRDKIDALKCAEVISKKLPPERAGMPSEEDVQLPGDGPGGRRRDPDRIKERRGRLLHRDRPLEGEKCEGSRLAGGLGQVKAELVRRSGGEVLRVAVQAEGAPPVKRDMAHQARGEYRRAAPDRSHPGHRDRTALEGRGRPDLIGEEVRGVDVEERGHEEQLVLDARGVDQGLAVDGEHRAKLGLRAAGLAQLARPEVKPGLPPEELRPPRGGQERFPVDRVLPGPLDAAAAAHREGGGVPLRLGVEARAEHPRSRELEPHRRRSPGRRGPGDLPGSGG
jgi:hypothetical protein